MSVSIMCNKQSKQNKQSKSCSEGAACFAPVALLFHIRGTWKRCGLNIDSTGASSPACLPASPSFLPALSGFTLVTLDSVQIADNRVEYGVASNDTDSPTQSVAKQRMCLSRNHLQRFTVRPVTGQDGSRHDRASKPLRKRG